jgi:hypothetical protein
MAQIDPSHRSSHLQLLNRVPHYANVRRVSRISAVVVPTIRPHGVSSGVALAAQVAASLDAVLVVVRTGPATRQPFPRELAAASSHGTVVIDLPQGMDLGLPRWASDEHPVATLHRASDLSMKRNLGVLLGRVCAWDLILFLDDDIRVTPFSGGGAPSSPPWDEPYYGYTRFLRRLNDVQADFFHRQDLHAAGFIQLDFDDNSVVCHARRLAGLEQESFISGGATVLRASAPIPLASNAYNEDWLGFLILMLNGVHSLPSSSVKYVGPIHQDAYDPFVPTRALAEELGDTLAEGLLSVVAQSREDVLVAATSELFWKTAVEARATMITEVISRLSQQGALARPPSPPCVPHCRFTPDTRRPSWPSSSPSSWPTRAPGRNCWTATPRTRPRARRPCPSTTP